MFEVKSVLINNNNKIYRRIRRLFWNFYNKIVVEKNFGKTSKMFVKIFFKSYIKHIVSKH